MWPGKEWVHWLETQLNLPGMKRGFAKPREAQAAITRYVCICMFGRTIYEVYIRKMSVSFWFNGCHGMTRITAKRA